jgi:hypothetical protein
MTKKKNNPANATVRPARKKAKRAKKAAVAPQELDIDETHQEELEINLYIVKNKSDKSLPCIGAPCQYKKNKKLEGKILPGKPAVRLSRQANDLAAEARDDSLDVYAHLVCCCPTAYAAWIQQKGGADRWYSKDEVLRMLETFPGMKELEDQIYDALHTASELSPSRIASASADRDRGQARKFCEHLKKYWWAQVEFGAKKGDLPTASERLTLDCAKYMTRLDGVENSLGELLKDSQEMSQDEVEGADEDIDADDDMDDDEDSESDAH